jgi:hypothetical protein
MNAPPLNEDTRRMGGLTRDAGRPEWEKQFMGVLAGSAKILKKDHPAASDAKQAVEILKTEAARFPWSILFLVGRDGNTVNSTVPEADAIARVNQMGGAIGLAGYLFLRDRRTSFVRPFISSLDVEGQLRALVEKRWEDMQAVIRGNKDEIEEQTSQANGTVYTDGVNASIFYSWQPSQKPPKGWELAGRLYVVGQEKGWVTKARLTDAKWQAVVEQAMPHFNAKVREVIALLNQLGLGLSNFKAVVAVLNKPRVAKDLEKALQKLES